MDVPRTRGDNPFTHSILPDRPQVPRRHGDAPSPGALVLGSLDNTPHARGYTHMILDHKAKGLVRPARTGINRLSSQPRPADPTAPRTHEDKSCRHETRPDTT